MKPRARKIPVPKRHRGVRDPLQQLADKYEKIKDTINNPPKQQDHQELPNSFKNFLRLKESVDSGEYEKSRQKKPNKAKTLQFGDTYMTQLPKEPESDFLQRASRKNEDRIKEANFASKYNVDIVRNEKTGAIQMNKKPKNVIDELIQNKSMGKRAVKRQKQREEKLLLKKSLAENKKLKKEKKKDLKRKEEDTLLNEYQFDNVPFGEVVHGPPSLNVKPRRADKLDGARPGRKSLLLLSLMSKGDDNEEDEPRKKSKKSKIHEVQKVDMKGKRKNLPASARMILEREQQNVVAAYRQAKKDKFGHNI